MIELSARNLGIWSYENFLVFPLVGVITTSMLGGLFLLVFNEIRTAVILTSIIETLLGLVNYYTLKFHGEPFSILDIFNISTALSVLDNYQLQLEKIPMIIILVNVVIVVFAFFYFKKAHTKRKYFIIPIFILSIGMYLSYFSTNPIVRRNVVSQAWDYSINSIGYLPSFFQYSISSINAVQKPIEYDEKTCLTFLQNLSAAHENKSESSNLPDVILILNESYYDLDLIVDTGYGENMFKEIKNLENAVFGYTITPGKGGGTNKSEYELLTTNSMNLLPIVTPFTYLNFKNANSVISYFNKLNYTTLGTHGFYEGNYARNKVYPQLGFDYLKWEKDYINLEYYGNRIEYATDQSIYGNIIDWYQELITTDRPVFMYCLTIQNHGDWNKNAIEMNDVNIEKDFDQYSNSVNEYLSCISLSVHAFKELTEYYKTCGRDVIVIMTGDHSPAFAPALFEDYGKKITTDEYELRVRSTPFVIWANKEGFLKEGDLSEPIISMNYLVPYALRVTGLPISGYYGYLNTLMEKAPVLTTYGKYLDNDFEAIPYQEACDDVKRYFEIEYLNIKQPEKTSYYYNP